MPLFRDKIASESCPAKTAESIGYGVTFTVLGFLLISNYSGLSSVERESQSLLSAASTQTTEPVQITAALDRAAPIIGAASPNTELADSGVTATLLPQADLALETNQFNTSPPAWHAALESIEPSESYRHQRGFSAADWNKQSEGTGQQHIGFTEEFLLSLPLIEPAPLLDASPGDQSQTSNVLVGSATEMDDPIREITVTGTETARLSARPDNILRPQIPRPYRAQEIQRSFVLPPRIQALKP